MLDVITETVCKDVYIKAIWGSILYCLSNTTAQGIFLWAPDIIIIQVFLHST